MIDQALQNLVDFRGDLDADPSSSHLSLHHDSPKHSPSYSNERSQARPTTSTHTSRLPREDISRIREQVIMSRLDLRERRVDMRQQHVIVRNLEAQILRHWQMDVGSVDQEAIRHLHGELCTALEQLGPMEEDYDDKEDGLDTLEFDLEVKEKRFYRHHLRTASEDSFESPSTRRTSISTLSEGLDRQLPDRQDFMSPETQYYSRIGDAKIVRERLMELEAQRAHYLDIERDREALNIPLYQENIDFLSNYENEYAEHMAELDKIEKDIQGLGIEAGFVMANDLNDVAVAPDVAKIANINPIIRRASSATEPGQFGLPYITKEEPPRRKSEGDVWEIPKDPRSTRERINQWLLERLKDSKLEKARHMAILNDPKLDKDAWWNLVLEFWQMDLAARSSKSSSRHVSGASTSAKPPVRQDSLKSVSNKASSGATTRQSTEGLLSRREETTNAAPIQGQGSNRSRASSRSKSQSDDMSRGSDRTPRLMPILYARALYDYGINGGTSVSFHQGDIIKVRPCQESGWWDGVTNGVRGWLSNTCTTVDEPETDYEESYTRSNRANQALLAKISTWPKEIERGYDIRSFDQFKYLDLAAKPSSTAKKGREKWDSVLGC
ncbi:MAG: hypothetical protein L6R41_003896 [Letrouitia leprolyta]|nr:MAG: hypothetical protein L6R41_003896 [Letrouitia leprolyta]